MTTEWPGKWHTKQTIIDSNSVTELTEFQGRLTMVGSGFEEWLQYESNRDKKLTQLGN